MQRATAQTARPPSRAPDRWIAVAGFYDARVRALVGVRVARWLGAAIAIGFAIAMLVLSLAGGRDVLDVVAIRGLEWLAWVAAGLAALSAAGDLAALDAREGLTELSRARGYVAREISIARTLATARAIARACGWPTVALSLLALLLSGTLDLALRRALLCLALSGYVVLLALVLAALARWSASLSARRPRAVFVALVLGPYLAREVWPLVPSVPSFFAGLVPHLIAIGVVPL